MKREGRIRLLLMINSVFGGGAEKQFLALATRLDRSSFDVSICLTADRGAYPKTFKTGDFNHCVMVRKSSRYDFPRILQEVRTAIGLVQPDIVHSWLPYSDLINIVLRRHAGHTTAISVRNALKSRHYQDPANRFISRFALPYTLKRADCVFVNSSCGYTDLQRMGRTEDRLCYIPNGIDCAVAPPLPNPPHRGRLVAETQLLAAGRLVPQKGFTNLIHAVKLLLPAHPHLRLRIVGEGSERRALQRTIDTLGIGGHVSLDGYCDGMRYALCEADIFVLPSLFEGMPNTLMEAMAAARPIVATSVDGVLDLITDGENGLLAPPGDGQSLAAAIDRLIVDTELARRLADHARETISTFDFANIVPQYEARYRKLADHG